MAEFKIRLIIAEHFDKLKNKIDINTETLFDTNRQMNESRRNEINTIRDNQIKKLDEIERENFSLCFSTNKPVLLLNDVNIELNLEKLKEDILISRDCILLDDENLINKTSLWIVPFFVSKVNMEFLM